MKQPGFFDVEERYEELDAMGDPLSVLKRTIPWEAFRPIVSKIHEKARRSNAGRKPLDPVMMFKVLVLQSLYNISRASGGISGQRPHVLYAVSGLSAGR